MKNLQVQKIHLLKKRAAIGLLRIIIENKLSINLRDLISYSIRLI